MLPRPALAVAALGLALSAGACGSDSDSGSDSGGGQQVTFGRSPSATQPASTAPASSTPASTGPAGPALVGASSALFTIEVPEGWRREDKTLSGGISRSTWTSPDDPVASVLVDGVANATSRPSERAARVRANTSRRPGYQEVSFRATTIAGEEGWEWRYSLPGRGATVDWFLNSCKDGYAVQATARPTESDALLPTYRRVADSLRSTSC